VQDFPGKEFRITDNHISIFTGSLGGNKQIKQIIFYLLLLVPTEL
jgi:hypothetical protein